VSTELVTRARSGDRDAFAVLVERALGRMVGTAGLIVRDRAAAEDVAQEALVRAWRDLPTLRDPDRFEAWLYRLLIHSCQDHLRHERRRPAAVEWEPQHGPFTGDSSQLVVDRDELDRCLSNLTADQRTVVVLRYYVGLGDRQIADAVRLPVGTVKSRLSRAVSALRAELDAAARTVAAEEGAR